jgi:flavin reductase (DIM6/NTAB) family NADH-FMN oxidoreductase RutF
LTHPIWERFFTLAPLVVIGSKEGEGNYDLAPKHMALPLGWDNYFGFICTPRHRTYQNVRREKAFTVSFPKPEQIVLTSLAAAPRCEGGVKSSLTALPTFAAPTIDGVFLEDAYLFLECQLERIVDGFGENSLIAGKIVGAQLQESALREVDRDDRDILLQSPLLAYLSPGRYAIVDRSFSFPFPSGFQR